MPSNHSYDEVLAVICAELHKRFPDDDPISAATDMTKDVPLDSAGTMEFVFELETKLDVSLPLNELNNITRVHELARLILKLQQTQGSEP